MSNPNDKALKAVEEWRCGPLDREYPYVYVDGIYLKRSWSGSYENIAVIVAIGVNDDGYREVIGRALQDLADVLDAARGHPGQMHLDDGLLDAGFAPLVALDDRGGEAHPLELWHLERDLARRRGESALLAPGAVRRPIVSSLVRSRAHKLVGLLVEHGVDGLLDGFPDQLAKLGLHRLLVE